MFSRSNTEISGTVKTVNRAAVQILETLASHSNVQLGSTVAAVICAVISVQNNHICVVIHVAMFDAGCTVSSVIRLIDHRLECAEAPLRSSWLNYYLLYFRPKDQLLNELAC